MPSVSVCPDWFVIDNAYWPKQFESVHDEDILDWLEEHLFMVLLWPRPAGTDLLKETYISEDNVKALSSAADGAWQAILDKDLREFASYFKDSFEAQITMFPAMLTPEIEKVIDSYEDQSLAWKLAGAGGGGYMILVADHQPKGSMKIKIRRKETGL